MVSRILILLLLVLGTGGTLPLPNRAAAQEAATPAAAPGDLHWVPCDDVADAECAMLDVPIDPAQPDGSQLTLRLARLPALDPSRSLGSLLIIPGGPGVGISASGGTFGVLRPLFSLDELRETFDVVTYASRGIRASSAI